MPHSPTASPSCWLMRATMSLLVFPASTICTTSIIVRSVYRWPSTNRDGDAQPPGDVGHLFPPAVHDDDADADLLQGV